MESFKDRIIEIPEELNEYLGTQVSINDRHCGEPIAKGFIIKKRIPNEMFSILNVHGRILFLQKSVVLIMDRITIPEVIELYGKITNIEVNPKGGFKSITYGQTKFIDRSLTEPVEVIRNLKLEPLIKYSSCYGCYIPTKTTVEIVERT